jgi:hypothetical protein
MDSTERLFWPFYYMVIWFMKILYCIYYLQQVGKLSRVICLLYINIWQINILEITYMIN